MPEKHFIYGVHITNRVKCVPDVQAVLTKYGCSIRTRLGLHDVHDNFCSPSGLLVLEMVGDEKELAKFEKEIKAVVGAAHVKKMVFGH